MKAVYQWSTLMYMLQAMCGIRHSIECLIPHIACNIYMSALKISWIKRENMNRHCWQKLFDMDVAQGRFLWERSSEALRNLSESVKNPFWAEVFIALAKLDDSIIVGIDEIGRCCLWYSKTRRFKTTEILSWDRKGIRYINDLLKETG